LSISKAALILHAKYLSAFSDATPVPEKVMTLATGILPALHFLVYEDQETRSFEKNVPAPRRQLRSSASAASPGRETETDAFSYDGDYSCKSCGQELFNSYFRKENKGKDNICCRQCHSKLHQTEKTKFHGRKRFFEDDAGLKELLVELEAMVDGKSVEYAEETVVRLKVVANPNDAGLKDEVEKLLKKHWAIGAALQLDASESSLS
jgi:DNA-directed RNA polymerase subunit RPC12/RpoP